MVRRLRLDAIFVAPFQGILSSDALRSGGSVLDGAAIVAFIGWTILEFLILAGISALDRESYAASRLGPAASVAGLLLGDLDQRGS